MVAVPFSRFDADPLDLKDPSKESTRTAIELTNDKLTSPYTIDVLAPDLAGAQALVKRLGTLPEVKQVLWLGSFVPEDQGPKLDILSQMQLFLGPLFDSGAVVAPATPEQERQAVAAYTAHLVHFLGSPKGSVLGQGGKDLVAALQAFQAMPGGGDIGVLHQVLLGGLPGRLDVLKEAIQAGPLTVDTMPAEVKSDWIAADGRVRLQVFPKGNVKDETQLAQFVAAVRAAAPNATGAPVAILESGRTVSNAFRDASITALIAITIVLGLTLRRLRDVVLVVVPLVMAGLYAMATCVIVDIPFNYANVIAVPLLMGIGVAFDIYFVMAWRRSTGPVALLQTSTARAVVFSACTTTTAFGSLALSHHAGTASMGVLLMVTLAYVVFCTLFIQPALMAIWGRGTAGR
jgi:hopanoid biosynthesis associated RND transporter like protein HpnN